MVSVIYIGYYNENGKFENEMWNAYLNWIAKKCDNVQIYTQLENSEILNCFGTFGKVIQQPSPDESLNYKSYIIIIQNDNIWEEIKTTNFDIDNGITHMYFLKGDILIGELEVDDCENFIFLNISKSENDELARITPNIFRNIKNCQIRKAQIDYLVDAEEWIPIGLVCPNLL